MLAAAALVPIKTLAAIGVFNLDVSGTVKIQNEDNTNKMTLTTKSFNEKYLYKLISAAVAHVQDTIATNTIADETLPSDGYIAFNPSYEFDGVPNGPDDSIYGLFYVTNKSGFYYPLSGYDSNGQFYSFMEFDAYITYANGQSNPSMNVDFGYNASDIGDYSVDRKTGKGSGTSTSNGMLYMHDDPYTYDAFDYPDNFISATNSYYPVLTFDNYNVIQIQGVFEDKMKLQDFDVTDSKITLTGTGNFFTDDDTYSAIIIKGAAKLTPQ